MGNCGLRSPLPFALVLRARSNLSAPAGARQSLLATADNTTPNLEQHTPLVFRLLGVSQQQTHTVHLEGGPTAFVASWSEGTINVSLTDPNGTTIDPAFAANHPESVIYRSDEKSVLYYVTNAVPGAWQIHLESGDNLPSQGVTYTAFAALQSPLSLSGNVDRNWYAPGDTAVITASFSQPPTQATVKAELLYGDGSVTTIQLSSRDGAVYEGSHTVVAIPGFAEVRLTATGTLSQGIPFERGTSLMFQVSPADTTLTGLYGDTPDTVAGSSLSSLRVPGSHRWH